MLGQRITPQKAIGICGLLIGRVSSIYKLSMRCQKVRNKLTFLILQLVLVNTRGGRLRRQKIRKLAPGIEAGSRGTDQNPPVYITTVLRQLCYICWNLNTSSTLSQGAVKKRSGTLPWAQCPWPCPRMCSESLRKCTQAARGQHARCTRGLHPRICLECQSAHTACVWNANNQRAQPTAVINVSLAGTSPN